MMPIKERRELSDGSIVWDVICTADQFDTLPSFEYAAADEQDADDFVALVMKGEFRAVI